MGAPEGVYTELKQGLSKPFTSFIDHLTQAVDRQVSDEAAKPLLLRSLTIANANAECKRIINALPGQPTLTEMIEACSKVGTPQHITAIQADVWTEQVGKFFSRAARRILKNSHSALFKFSTGQLHRKCSSTKLLLKMQKRGTLCKSVLFQI